MTRHYDLIIIGQGIAGTLLHHELSKRGKQILVIDKGHKEAASAVASGLINPITGRKYVKSWMFDELDPQLRVTYQEIENVLSQNFINDHKIVRTLSSIKEENLWHSKSAIPSYEKYFAPEVDDSEYRELINGAVSFGEVAGGSKVDLRSLIKAYRELLIRNNQILEERFQYDKLTHYDSQKWEYRKGVTSDKIVFCEGWQLRKNPFFAKLGQEAAKGEVLIVKLPNVKITRSIKKKIFITPLSGDLYWVGSTYEWEFDDASPSETKKQYLIEALNEMYQGEYKVIDHWAGVRPTTVDRRPLLGHHPEYKSMYLFNGLGTKGASLAPYWAKQMATFILDDTILPTEVDLSRFC